MGHRRQIMTHILVTRLEKMVRTERKITDQIIKTLIEIESQNIHLEMGYESIFAFLVQHLGYSESAAQRRSAAMRLIQKAPEISDKLQTGSLNLTQVAELERVTRQMPIAKISEVIPKIENKNTRQTQQIIAHEFDLTAIQHESTRTQKDESVRLQITLTKEQYELFKKAGDLLSHIKPGATHAEVITMLAQKFVKQKLGIVVSIDSSSEAESSKTIVAKEVCEKHLVNTVDDQNTAVTAIDQGNSFKNVNTKNTAATAIKFNKRKQISIKTRRVLLKKAQHQCEFVSSDGKRCQAHSLLEIDHIRPVSIGGKNNLQNLRIYCRAHNQGRNQVESLADFL